MSRKGVAKIVNKDKNKVYVISSNNDIVIYLDKVMSDLENGWHKNSKLQQDYFSNPNAFTTKLITTTCKNEIEVNEVRCSEIKKYWPNGYNKKCTTSHRGGNTNPFERSGENEDFIMTGFMERLFDILNESNLPQEGKDFLQDIIDKGFVTSEYDLIRAIKDMERLLDILNKSKLKSKDKKDLKVKILNGTIFSEDDLKTEIENILKTYKSKSKNKKSSNKSSSSRANNKKPKKHTWDEYYKTHNTKHEKTSQDKLDDTTIKSERQYVPLADKCPVCSNLISKNYIYCPDCGHKLKNQPNYYGNANSIKAKLFMIEDSDGTIRYSVSKTFGFIILMIFIIADIIILLFGIPRTKLYYITLLTFGGLLYYVLFILAGFIYRKLSE